MYKRQGLIQIAKSYNEDDVMEVVLDAGADDMSSNETGFEVITSPTNLSGVLEALKNKNIDTIDAETTMRADVLVDLDSEGSEKVLKIMNFLDDLDDVQEVYTNGEFSDDFEIEE